jgi:protein phosphatase
VRIRIPSPALVVLVGEAGAGKSTLAPRLFSAQEILSSDQLRGAIRGDPTDQSLTRVAFKILHREVVRRLAARRTVVIDATNLTHGARASLVRRAAIAGIPPIAVVLIPPGGDVHARNHSRSAGVVPADIVDRQLADAAALGVDPTGIVDRLMAEGFVAVHVLTTSEEIARVAVERVSR